MTPLRTVLAVGVALAVAACSGTEPRLAAEGTIVHATGCTVILTAAQSLQPLTLPSAFRVESLRVRITYRPKPTNNVCMAGDVVEILSIERAP